MADAGWYPDPQDPNAEQYWDGQMWTGQRRGAGSAGPQEDTSAQSGAQETRINPVFAATPEPPAQQPQPWQEQGAQGAQPPQQQPSGAEQDYGAGYGAAQGYGAGYGAAQGYGAGYGAAQGYPQGGQGQIGQPQGGPSGGAQPWAGQPGQPGNTSGNASGKKRRNLLVAAGVVVVLVAAGLITWLVLPGDDAPSITYQGKSINAADTVLTTAETAVSKTVSTRHGVKSGDTRCYFVRADKPASGAKKSDVDTSLSCGPVLFVDGNTAQEYLPVRLTAAPSGSKVDLTPQSSLDGVDPSSVRSGYTLVRPDGKKQPTGNGGLKVPLPPATTKDAIIAASLGSTPAPPALTTAVMVGRTRKVTVSAAGYITRYGSGTDARSAASGQKLLAFRTTYDVGDVSSGTGAQVKLLVDGAAKDVPMPGTDEYVVASVPASSSVSLQLVDSGDTQSLSLPQGMPATSNIKVLTRTHRTQLLGRTFNVIVDGTKAGKKLGSATYKTTATLARLDYWSPANTSAKPSNPSRALLSVRVNFTDSKAKGGPFGYDPPYLHLRLPDGTVVQARNVAPKGKIANVFDVPATFTTGVLTISGAEKDSSGVTVKVRTAMNIPISIAAG